MKKTFSDKTKAADIEWKIKTFKQGKKKNVQVDIIKMILGYLLIAAPETLKKWKVAITSVGQKYEFMEGYHDY